MVPKEYLRCGTPKKWVIPELEQDVDTVGTPRGCWHLRGAASVSIESRGRVPCSRTRLLRLATTTARHPQRSHSVSLAIAASRRGAAAIGTPLFGLSGRVPATLWHSQPLRNLPQSVHSLRRNPRARQGRWHGRHAARLLSPAWGSVGLDRVSREKCHAQGLGSPGWPRRQLGILGALFRSTPSDLCPWS